MTEIEIQNVNCAPWRNERRAPHCVIVDVGAYPRVRVWDPIGKLYTVCHSLTPASERAIIARARKLVAMGRSGP